MSLAKSLPKIDQFFFEILYIYWINTGSFPALKAVVPLFEFCCQPDDAFKFV